MYNLCHRKVQLCKALVLSDSEVCTCINGHASASFMQYKVSGGAFDEPIKVTNLLIVHGSFRDIINKSDYVSWD